MNLRDLKYLIAVAETEHFGHAAARCFVSQPTLSGQIKKLEQELGVILFERTNRSVSITPIGTEIIKHAKLILEQADVIKQLAQAQRDPLAGALRVGAIPTVSPYLIPLILHPLKQKYPQAAILVHPESPAEVTAMADVVGSTSQLIAAARDLPNQQMIVATDNGIFYKMQQAAPGKELIEAPTGGTGASCRSCGHCPWMAMNDLPGLARVLESGANEIQISEDVRVKALRSTQRMLDFAAQLKQKVLGSGTA